MALDTVQPWVARAAGQRLDRVDWDGRPSIAHTIHRTDRETEDLILVLRRELKEQSALGEFGAQAIHRALVARGHPAVPTVRTIGRVLERRGALDGRRRVRRLPPPRGWYLPAVGQGQAELDSFDIVEGLLLPDGNRHRSTDQHLAARRSRQSLARAPMDGTPDCHNLDDALV